MSHFTVTVAVGMPGGSHSFAEIEERIAELLAPYDENATDGACLTFHPVDDLQDEYEKGTMISVQMPNGIICSPYDTRFCKKYVVQDGKVYKRPFGPQKTPKRTKKAKQMKVLQTSMKKAYPTLAEYAVDYCGYSYSEEEGAFGYYSNPNAKWDWWQIGGRWPFEFLVKKECASAIEGDRSWMNKDEDAPAPEGYRWVAGARKSDIQWGKMKELRIQEQTKYFEMLEKWFLEDIVPKNKGLFLTKTEDGIQDWQSMAYIKGETLEQYLERKSVGKAANHPHDPYAVLSEAGWQGSGEMGWFGYSHNNVEELTWNQTVEDFIASVPDQYFLVSVDCHI